MTDNDDSGHGDGNGAENGNGNGNGTEAGDEDGRDDDGDAPPIPDREEFDHAPIGHAEVHAGMTIAQLVEAYGAAGIGAADLHEAVDVTADMFDPDVTVFMGLAGAMVPAGMRAIVADLIRDGYVDALVTTGATLTHDAIEAIGGTHHRGRSGPDDNRSREADRVGAADRREHDEQLRDEGVDRIYNVYLPQEHFTLFERHLRDSVFPTLENTVAISDLTAALGRANAAVNEREGIEADPGIAAAAHEHDVPVYCPAIQDSILGLQAWLYSRTSDFELAALADTTAITDQAFAADRTGALVVGGGVPKNFVLQSMLVTPDAFDLAVQLTMDPEATGGLSGASLDEARSWGKLRKTARNVTVYGDATITLPIVVAAARDRLE